MVGHRGCSAGSYLADPASPIPSHCASIVVTSTLRVMRFFFCTLSFKYIRQNTRTENMRVIVAQVILTCCLFWLPLWPHFCGNAFQIVPTQAANEELEKSDFLLADTFLIVCMCCVL